MESNVELARLSSFSWNELEPPAPILLIASNKLLTKKASYQRWRERELYTEKGTRRRGILKKADFSLLYLVLLDTRILTPETRW